MKKFNLQKAHVRLQTEKIAIAAQIRLHHVADCTTLMFEQTTQTHSRFDAFIWQPPCFMEA